MKVAVIGGTGKTGRAVAERLLAGGHRVRVLARNPARAQDLAQRGAELLAADLGTPQQLARALEGMEAVYYCSPLGLGRPEPLETEQTWTRNAFRAARAAHLAHFVFLSVVWADRPRGVRLLALKGQLEEELRASTLPHTILRPNWFMENLDAYQLPALAQGKFGYPLAGDRPLQPVSVRDIAEVTSRTLTAGPKNRAYELGGPEALTFAQMAAILSRVLGRPVAYQQLPEDDFLSLSSPFLGAAFAQILLELYRAYGHEGCLSDPAPLLRDFPIRLTHFEDYARTLAARLREFQGS